MGRFSEMIYQCPRGLRRLYFSQRSIESPSSITTLNYIIIIRYCPASATRPTAVTDLQLLQRPEEQRPRRTALTFISGPAFYPENIFTYLALPWPYRRLQGASSMMGLFSQAQSHLRGVVKPIAGARGGEEDRAPSDTEPDDTSILFVLLPLIDPTISTPCSLGTTTILTLILGTKMRAPSSPP